MNSRGRVKAGLRDRIISESGGTCAICGQKFDHSLLELAHINPLSAGGTDEKDNVMLLCVNCHRQLNRVPREIEFARFLESLLRSYPGISDVRSEAVLGRDERFRADLFAKRRQNDHDEVLLIECKTPQALAALPITTALYQLTTYRNLLGHGQMVLAVPATLPTHDAAALAAAGVEIWDLTYLVQTFSRQARELPASYFRTLLLTQQALQSQTSREKQLSNEMRTCRAGKEDWRLYQSIVGEILECLFTPALDKPIFELSDLPRANRRDFILPNHAEDGFWAFMRDTYKADYVVIDAKNSGKKLTKSDILQVANYLKSHGAGLFGMIVCRHGAGETGCQHTIREEWQQHRKLILILNDDDVEAMLLARFEGREPEDLIKLKIQQFRLSM
jgi:hypothetical protein